MPPRSVLASPSSHNSSARRTPHAVAELRLGGGSVGAWAQVDPAEELSGGLLERGPEP
jgi:hypothetical protein